jgi:hypothetical protein
MLSLIKKGIYLRIDPYYFMMILAIRSCAAACYKTFLLGHFLGRQIKLNKIKINLFTNGIPTIMVYIALNNRFELLHPFFDMGSFSDNIPWIFIYYMIVNRIVRSGLRVLKQLRKAKLKKEQQQKEQQQKKLAEE